MEEFQNPVKSFGNSNPKLCVLHAHKLNIIFLILNSLLPTFEWSDFTNYSFTAFYQLYHILFPVSELQYSLLPGRNSTTMALDTVDALLHIAASQTITALSHWANASLPELSRGSCSLTVTFLHLIMKISSQTTGFKILFTFMFSPSYLELPGLFCCPSQPITQILLWKVKSIK